MQGPVDVAVTVLTGGRASLLETTLSSFHKHVPQAASLPWFVLANGGDEPTLEVLSRYPHISYEKTKKLLPIGKALSTLMSTVNHKHTHVLHLEDDWECVEKFFDEAVRVVKETRPGQLRLRHHRERVLPRHEITKRRIDWATLGKHRASSSAHFTFNPSLVEREVWNYVTPCNGETLAQQKFLALGRSTIQLMPGAFVHIGGGDKSLAEKTGGR